MFRYQPQDISKLEAEDRRFMRNAFFVYVLETDFGHYVGHTSNMNGRVKAHQDGDVESTDGTNPRLAWVSRQFGMRFDAASFEAALAGMRDRKHPRYQEITGLVPRPFIHVQWRDEIGYTSKTEVTHPPTDPTPDTVEEMPSGGALDRMMSPWRRKK